MPKRARIARAASKVVGRGVAGRKPTYASLKRQADKVFSEWIRRKDADSAGMVQCITCGNVDHWKRMQASHYVSRVHLATRFDPTNTAPACYACNVLRRGNMAEYAVWLTKTYGPQILEELVAKKHSQIKLTRLDLEAIRDSYREKLKELG